jgi:hypothetical protein
MRVEQFHAARKVDTPSGVSIPAASTTFRQPEADMADLTSLAIAGLKRLLRHFAIRWRVARMHRHINELPDHILDDIGWPEAYTDRLVRHDTREGKAATVRCKKPEFLVRSSG